MVLHQWDDLKQSQKSDTQWMKNLYSNKRNDTQKGHFCHRQCSTISLPKPVGDAWEMFSAPLYSSHYNENCPGPIKLLPLQCPHRVLPMSRLTNLAASTACSRRRVWPLQDYSDMPLFFLSQNQLGLFSLRSSWIADWRRRLDLKLRGFYKNGTKLTEHLVGSRKNYK